MSKNFKDIKHKKDHKALPPISGILTCIRGHERIVIDLNPERVTVLCSQVSCGAQTSIRKGFSNHEQHK